MEKVTKITPLEGELVETDSGEYIRYAPEAWEVRMGDSMETVYRCEHLEQAYQEFRRTETAKANGK